MTSASRIPSALLCAILSLFLMSCGGSHNSPQSSSMSSGTNTQAVSVNAGPDGNYANGLFTSVTVCAPGTSNCRTINNVLADTGSFGLRLLSSAVGTLESALPPQQTSGGSSVLECAQFVDSVLWGPVKTADVEIGGEKASSIPIEVIDSSTVPVPSSCSAHGPSEETLTALGANGILGIGFFVQDCGSACAGSGSSNPGFYYGCSGSSCQVISETATQQVSNPVASFSADNNGVLIQLPGLSASAGTVSGSLIFGVGTQSDNSLGSAQVFRPDNFGNLKTSFKGQTYAGFIDSGSNAYFFLDSSITGIPNCPSTQNGFYCPSSPVNLSATNTGASGSNAVNFTVGNAAQLFGAHDAAFPTLGGPNPASFDWGLPFFYGRSVFVAIEGATTPSGAGPFWAY